MQPSPAGSPIQRPLLQEHPRETTPTDIPVKPPLRTSLLNRP
jgi:hypothetical protein